MGFFPDYTKAGPGVDKNAPKKKGIFLYFELLWRYLWKFIQSNMLYTAVSLPILFIYHYLFFIVFSTIYGSGADLAKVNHSALVFTVILAIFWGTGPASCGYTRILRNMAREEHVWVSLDFFKTMKKSFKRGLVFLVTDLLVFIVGGLSIWVYQGKAEQNMLYAIPMYIVIIGLAIYTLIHFFIYELEVTFENKIREIYKNAMLMSVLAFPMCAFVAVIICFLAYIFLSIMPAGVLLAASFVILIGLMRFMIDFCSARFIKRHFIKEIEESEK